MSELVTLNVSILNEILHILEGKRLLNNVVLARLNEITLIVLCWLISLTLVRIVIKSVCGSTSSLIWHYIRSKICRVLIHRNRTHASHNFLSVQMLLEVIVLNKILNLILVSTRNDCLLLLMIENRLLKSWVLIVEKGLSTTVIINW